MIHLAVYKILSHNLVLLSPKTPCVFEANEFQELKFTADEIIKSFSVIAFPRNEKNQIVPERVNYQLEGKAVLVNILLARNVDVYYSRGENMIIAKIEYE